MARETFGVAHVVARIYDPKRAEVYERLGIPTVATVPWTTHRLLSVLLGDKHVEDWRDPSGAVALMQVAVHEGWIGRRVDELETASGARVAFVTRFGKGMLPTASTVLQDGDQVHVLVTDDDRGRGRADRRQRRRRGGLLMRVAIAGAGGGRPVHRRGADRQRPRGHAHRARPGQGRPGQVPAARSG